MRGRQNSSCERRLRREAVNVQLIGAFRGLDLRHDLEGHDADAIGHRFRHRRGDEVRLATWHDVTERPDIRLADHMAVGGETLDLNQEHSRHKRGVAAGQRGGGASPAHAAGSSLT